MSYSTTKTFTKTNAKYIAAKVATDLKRIQRFYGSPTDHNISQYEEEIIALLNAGYLGTVTYGFKKDNKYIEPTLRYTAAGLADNGVDDDPGKIRPNADISGASFYSYLTYSSKWDNLSSKERVDFKAGLPYQRTGATEPGINGYLDNDRTYSSGNNSLNRSSVKSYK